MSINIDAISNQILSQAIAAGGATWDKIKKTAPFFIEGYAQIIGKTALKVAAGKLSKTDGRMIERHARLMLAQGIATTSLIILSQVQAFINGVIATVKTAINAALPVPLL